MRKRALLNFNLNPEGRMCSNYLMVLYLGQQLRCGLADSDRGQHRSAAGWPHVSEGRRDPLRWGKHRC